MTDEERGEAQTSAAIWRIAASAIRPPPDRTPSQWAEAERVLTSKTSAAVGPWRNWRSPFAVAPMDALGPQHPARRVVCMWSSQVSKTEVLLNVAGYYMHADPCPIMLVQPTDKHAERVSKHRIQPMIEASPALRERVIEARSRVSGNTLAIKEFPGGLLMIVGANSPTDLASSPIRVLLIDESDRIAGELQGEGDPVHIVTRRTATFANRKIAEVSSPTVHLESRIEASFARTDQNYYQVPCPHCGVYQRLRWANVRWASGRPELACYVCEVCEVEIPHSAKRGMVAAGVWVPEDEAAAEALRAEFAPPLVRDPDAVGYHLSTLYSLFFSWGEMAAEFVRAARDPVLLRVFVNTLLGEVWRTEEGEGIGDPDALMRRREDYGPGRRVEVPAGVALLTAGIDVQADRAVVEIVGWGPGEESWSIEYIDVYGDPSVDPSVGGALWEGLDAILEREYIHADGRPIAIAATCIDTGHHAINVYAFVKPRQRRRIWGVKGKQGDGSRFWPRNPTRHNKGKIDLYVLDTTAGKDAVYSRLKLEEAGPGYCHFPRSATPAYFAELTAERRTVRYTRGHRVSVYTCPHGRRNEALDVRVYAYAALQGLRSAKVDLRLELDKRRGGSDPKAASRASSPSSAVQNAREAEAPVDASQGTRRRLFLNRREGWLGR